MGKKLICVFLILLCLMSSCSKESNDFDLEKACVSLKINDSIIACGFLVNEDGNILTAAHSFKGIYEQSDISINAKISGKAYLAMLISIDFTKDIALLKIDVSAPEFVHLDSLNFEKCKYAYVYGKVGGKEFSATKLCITTTNINIRTDTKSYLGAILEGEIDLGLSGAPIIAENGKFLGMLIGKNANNNEIYAISYKEIKTYLEANI